MKLILVTNWWGGKSPFGIRIELANAHWIDDQGNNPPAKEVMGPAISDRRKAKPARWISKKISNGGNGNVKTLIFSPGDHRVGVSRGDLVQIVSDSFQRNGKAANSASTIDAEIVIFDPITAQVLSRTQTKLGPGSQGFSLSVGKVLRQ